MRVDGDPEVAWLVRRAGHVSKTVKGLLIGLAAALGLELTQDAGAAALALAGTVLAVLLGNVYGDAIQHEIEHGIFHFSFFINHLCQLRRHQQDSVYGGHSYSCWHCCHLHTLYTVHLPIVLVPIRSRH